MADDDEESEEEEPEAIRVEDITDVSELIAYYRDQEKNLSSPINLNISLMKEINLTELEWNHYELPPKKVKLTNSGHTAILSAKWFQERPYLTGGPLFGNYVFSQLHFHWGMNDMEGSEHTVDGTQYPVEMHVVHFKSTYLTQESALCEKDGVMVLVYFFKLQSQVNNTFQFLLDYFVDIQKAYTSIKTEAIPIQYFIRQFSNDYFIYWGNIKTASQSHLILWMICREPIGISAEQVEIFRNIYDEEEEQLQRNFRVVELGLDKTILHVNPSGSKYSTMLPTAQDADMLKDNFPRRRSTKKSLPLK